MHICHVNSMAYTSNCMNKILFRSIFSENQGLLKIFRNNQITLDLFYGCEYVPTFRFAQWILFDCASEKCIA